MERRRSALLVLLAACVAAAGAHKYTQEANDGQWADVDFGEENTPAGRGEGDDEARERGREQQWRTPPGVVQRDCDKARLREQEETKEAAEARSGLAISTGGLERPFRRSSICTLRRRSIRSIAPEKMHEKNKKRRKRKREKENNHVRRPALLQSSLLPSPSLSPVRPDCPAHASDPSLRRQRLWTRRRSLQSTTSPSFTRSRSLCSLRTFSQRRRWLRSRKWPSRSWPRRQCVWRGI